MTCLVIAPAVSVKAQQRASRRDFYHPTWYLTAQALEPSARNRRRHGPRNQAVELLLDASADVNAPGLSWTPGGPLVASCS